MSVAHDAVSESHTGTAGVASVASFTWNHVGGASARSALVFVFGIGATCCIGVTYGGVSMTAVPYTAADTDTEPFVRAYFLDNCGTGTKAVVVSRTNNAVVTYAVCMTQTAATACEVYLPGVMTQARGHLEHRRLVERGRHRDGWPQVRHRRLAGDQQPALYGDGLRRLHRPRGGFRQHVADHGCGH